MLFPVVWDDGWPVFNKGEPIRLQLEVPDGYLCEDPPKWRDDFTSSKLQIGWYRKSTLLSNSDDSKATDTVQIPLSRKISPLRARPNILSCTAVLGIFPYQLLQRCFSASRRRAKQSGQRSSVSSLALLARKRVLYSGGTTSLTAVLVSGSIPLVIASFAFARRKVLPGRTACTLLMPMYCS